MTFGVTNEPHVFYIGKHGVSMKDMFEDLKKFEDYDPEKSTDIKYVPKGESVYKNRWNMIQNAISNKDTYVDISVGEYDAYTRDSGKNKDSNDNSAKMMGTFTVKDERSVTSITPKDAPLNYNFSLGASKADIFDAVVKECSPSNVIKADNDDVVISYKSGRNWNTIEDTAFSGDTLIIKISYDGSDELKPCETGELTLNDSRGEATLTPKETFGTVEIYEDAAITARVYKDVFEAIVASSEPLYNKSIFDIQFASQYKQIGFKTTTEIEWVSLNDYHHGGTHLDSDGKKFGENKTEKIKIVFKGNDEYKAKTFGEYSLSVSPKPDNREESSIVLNEPLGIVDVLQGLKIGDSTYEAVFNAIVNESESQLSDFNRDSFDIEFCTVEASVIHWSDEWVSLNESYPVLGHKFGTRDNEQVRIIFYGDDNYKGNKTSDLTIKINIIEPSIKLNDMDVSLYDTQNLPDTKAGIEASIDSAVGEEIIPFDFMEDAVTKYQYFALGDAWYSEITKEIPINWVDIGEEPIAEIGDIHNFGCQRADKSIGDIEPGNFEHVRIVVTNKKYPGITVIDDAVATVEDLRAITEFKHISDKTITYDPDKEKEATAIIEAIKNDVAIIIAETGEPIDPSKFNFDNDISVELDEVKNAGETYDITVKYEGTEADYRPCSTTVKVTVKRAPSNIKVVQDNVTYDGKRHDPEVTVSPKAVDYVEVIVGVDGEVSGFVSINLPKSLQDRMDVLNNKFVDTILKLFPLVDKSELKTWLDKNGIPTNIYTYLQTKMEDGLDIKGAQEILEDISGMLNTKIFFLGNITVSELINVDGESFAKIVEILNSLPQVGGVTVSLGNGPKNAGIYSVTAVTTDPNYTISADTELFVINQKGWKTEDNISLKFIQSMSDDTLAPTADEMKYLRIDNALKNKLISEEMYNKLGLDKLSQAVRASSITIEQAENFTFGGRLYDGVKDITAEGNNQKHIGTLYLGLTAKGKPYASDTAPKELGVYSETVYVLLGNYIAKPISRIYRIEKNPGVLYFNQELNDGTTIITDDKEYKMTNLERAIDSNLISRKLFEALGLDKIQNSRIAHTLTIKEAATFDFGGYLADRDDNIIEEAKAFYVGVTNDGKSYVKTEAPSGAGIYTEVVYTTSDTYKAKPLVRTFIIQKNPGELHFNQIMNGEYDTVDDIAYKMNNLERAVNSNLITKKLFEELGLDKVMQWRSARVLTLEQAKKFKFGGYLTDYGKDKPVGEEYQSKVKAFYIGATYDGKAYASCEAPRGAGVYTEVVYLLDGDYKAKPIVRTYIIKRMPTSIDLKDIVMTYDDEFPPKHVGQILNVKGEEVEGLMASVKYVSLIEGYSSYTRPTEPGHYNMIATFAGTDEYLPSIDITKDLYIQKRDTNIEMKNVKFTYGDVHDFTQDATIKVDENKELKDKHAKVEMFFLGLNNGKIYFSHKAPTDAGTYYVVASYAGSSRYNGSSVVRKLEIERKSISKGTVNLGDALIYNGSVQKQGIESVTGLIDGSGNSMNVTFRVVRNTGKEAGEYKLVVIGTGNYKGRIVKTFAIAPDTAEGSEYQLGEGRVEMQVDAGENVEAKYDIGALIKSLVETGELDAEKLSQIADGEKVILNLTVKDVTGKTEEPQTYDKFKIGQEFDINLTMSMFDKEGKTTIDELKVKETTSTIYFKLKLNDALINTNKDYIRDYVVIRKHDGSTSILSTAYNKDDNSVSFSTNKFSYYAVGYMDAKIIVPGVATGDDSNIYLFLMLGLAAAIAGAAAVARRRKEN